MTNDVQIRPTGEGKFIGVVGDKYRVLVSGEESKGALAMFEGWVPPGGGPPPHIHTREQETFYVLEGEVTFLVEGQQQTAGPGTFVKIPQGVVHGFKNESEHPLRMIITVVPAGLDELFFEVGTPLGPDEPPSPPSAADIERLLAAAPKYGIEILPPPA